MKALKTRPFTIDPKARQRFTFAGVAKTFPVATRDAEAIDFFVKAFTESLGLPPKTGSSITQRTGSGRKRRFRVLSPPAVRVVSAYFPRRRKKVSRKRARLAARSGRVA